MFGIRALSPLAELVNCRKTGLRSRARPLAAATAIGVALVAVTGTPAAFGASPQVNHFRGVSTDVDPDFCGTGQQIDLVSIFRVNEWLAPHQGDYKSTASGTNTYTNPLTGDVVVRRFGGQSLDVAVSGDPAGIHVHDFITKGLGELFKTPHGGVLVRDAGYIVFRVTFDGDTFVGSEIVVNKGPHPQADSDFKLFCQIMPGALGL
jgi:hypothetical protein